MSGVHAAVAGSAVNLLSGLYWILLNPNSFQSDGAALDTSGNLHIVGQMGGEVYVTKYNSLGSITWQRKLGDSLITETQGDCAVDSSGNVYALLTTYASGNADVQLVKYNSSGTLQWQRRLSSSTEQLGYSLAVDSSGSVYIGGTNVSGERNAMVVKYDTNGNLDYQRHIKIGNTDLSGTGNEVSIVVNSSNEVYVACTSTGSGTDIQIHKLGVQGSISWQRRLYSSSTDESQGIALGASGSIYVVGSSNASGNYDVQIAKYNSSGTLQWQRRFGGASSQFGKSIATDPSENVYVLGNADFDIIIAKYDSSGTLLWQRRFGGSGIESSLRIVADNSNVYILGFTQQFGGSNGLILKLPADGSLTGTYNISGYSMSYTTSSYTETASSLTSEQSSWGSSTSGGLTSSTTTIPASTTNVTDTRVVIG